MSNRNMLDKLVKEFTQLNLQRRRLYERRRIAHNLQFKYRQYNFGRDSQGRDIIVDSEELRKMKRDKRRIWTLEMEAELIAVRIKRKVASKRLSQFLKDGGLVINWNECGGIHSLMSLRSRQRDNARMKKIRDKDKAERAADRLCDALDKLNLK